jgi:hypothetical protein
MPDDATDRPERHLTLPDFARECGAHPNTVRKLLREGQIPYTVQDLATGELVAQDAQRPKRFRYMLPASAIQHVVATLNPPVRTTSQVRTAPAGDVTTDGLHAPIEVVTKLRSAVERLEAENALLREHNAFLRDLTERLLPMLPPTPNTTSQTESPATQAPTTAPRRSWWSRMFRG